jgi:hypothetical protein
MIQLQIQLQIQLFGPYFSSFSTNSYGYYSQTSQNLVSNFRIFASASIDPTVSKVFLYVWPLDLCCFAIG